MKFSIVIATYGDQEWSDLAWKRAVPSVHLAHGIGNRGETIVLHESGATIAQVRNDAARKTKGDWLCFVDADDEVDLGYLDAMHLAIVRQKKPERCLFTPAVSYVRKGKPAPPIFLDRGISLEHDNWLVVGTVVHRDLFFEVGGFSDYPHGFEDWSLWAKCWKAGAEIVKIPDAIYRAHVNPQSKHRKQWRNRKWQVEMHQRVQKELFST